MNPCGGRRGGEGWDGRKGETRRGGGGENGGGGREEGEMGGKVVEVRRGRSSNSVSVIIHIHVYTYSLLG